MARICTTCEGTGRVVGEDGVGFRPSRPDHEEADECADCGGTGYRHKLPGHEDTMENLDALKIR
jgi:DnaJ-class molecular chaperone